MHLPSSDGRRGTPKRRHRQPARPAAVFKQALAIRRRPSATHGERCRRGRPEAEMILAELTEAYVFYGICVVVPSRREGQPATRQPRSNIEASDWAPRLRRRRTRSPMPPTACTAVVVMRPLLERAWKFHRCLTPTDDSTSAPTASPIEPRSDRSDPRLQLPRRTAPMKNRHRSMATTTPSPNGQRRSPTAAI